MDTFGVTISHSPINHFGHINIRNLSPYGGKQQSTLTRQKSLVDPTYFNVLKCHITQFLMTNFQQSHCFNQINFNSNLEITLFRNYKETYSLTNNC